MNASELTSVWVVEDNDRYRRTLARVINDMQDYRCEFDVDTAEGALHAIETKTPPAVLLLDIGLPGMDGIEAMRLLHRAVPKIKIVILTVFDDHDRIFRAVCGGADGYLLKTSTMDQVEQAIIQVMQGGASMSPEIARKVLDQYSGRRKKPELQALTDRESEVLKLTVGGLTKKDIAEALELSRHTVDSHLRNIYQKLHVNNRAGAVAAAVRDRLV